MKTVLTKTSETLDDIKAEHGNSIESVTKTINPNVYSFASTNSESNTEPSDANKSVSSIDSFDSERTHFYVGNSYDKATLKQNVNTFTKDKKVKIKEFFSNESSTLPPKWI